ncbi:MAG: hypothetical protein WDZ40_01900 [Candidatus Spechtbacterales bacterium]
MLWFYVTIISYLLFAVGNIFDRYILKGPLQHPRSYAFYIGASGIFAVFLIPFANFRVPPVSTIVLAVFAGSAVIVALYYLFRGIYEGNVSTQVPMVGAFAPVFTLFFGFIFAGERVEPSTRGFLALFFLILGIIFLSIRLKSHELHFTKKHVLYALLAGMFFGLGFVLTKMVYELEEFLNGYIWTTVGGVIMAFIFFFMPGTKEILFKESPITKKTLWLPLLGGKAIGTLGNVAQNYAISIAAFGQLAFISALAGVQHLGILIIAVFLYLTKPELLEETFTKRSLSIRLLGIIFIGAGIYLLMT